MEQIPRRKFNPSTLPAGSRARPAPPAAPRLAVWFRSLRASLGQPGLRCSLNFPPSPQILILILIPGGASAGRGRSHRAVPGALPPLSGEDRPVCPGPCRAPSPHLRRPAGRAARAASRPAGRQPLKGGGGGGAGVAFVLPPPRFPPRSGSDGGCGKGCGGGARCGRWAPLPAEAGRGRPGAGGGTGLAPSPLCECRLGKSPLPPGSVRRAGLPSLTLPLSEVPRGRAGGKGAARTAGGALWEVLERGSWQGSPLNKAVSCINGASGVPCREYVNSSPNLTRISSVMKPANCKVALVLQSASLLRLVRSLFVAS